MKSFTRSALRCLGLSFAGLLLAGCQALNHPPPVDIAQPTAVRVLPRQAPVAANGAIYQAGQYRPLFEDYRARMVGDTLTVAIVERVSASQTSNSSVNKKGDMEGAVTALPAFKPSAFNRASAAGSSANTFTGKGSTDTANNFNGTIHATVIEVLANGHLVIAGEKQIGVNANVDVLRFSGEVDPLMIQPGNVVASAQIANARIEHRGRGQAAEAQGIGWLSRVFLSLAPF
ncbi:MAG TPA: flagellar basal body L-ring protein FlgH [Burkholderiaceae bacterium]|jgi:flagellar L-ring protein precursor FlgH|nr:flagellar basal body L-ring protein FlgH [Burkholderiaceae bacterium]